MSIFFIMQTVEENYKWAVPLIVSNFITILLIFFFTKDRSQQQITYQEKIAKLQAFSLRAQMNPHFIFNALNGVQSVMILQGEQMANKYLGIFSKLLRFTIEMTNTEMISLEDELGYLSAYIELQKMRMQSAIEYNVVVDQEIDISNCFLPTMLLQPLIENAIIHGITPLKTKGVIDLVVRKNEQVLILSVNDNGVGRKESARLKNFRKDGVHKSFANQIMKERIDIFNYLEKSKTDFRMEDVDSSIIHTGTRSILTLPFKDRNTGILINK